MNLDLQLAIQKTRLALAKVGDWDEEKHPREKDGKWTGGGGSGEDRPQLMHGTTYDSGLQILKEGFHPGEGGRVFATPRKDIAIEYGWTNLVNTVVGEPLDARFAVVVLKKGASGFRRDSPGSVSDTWQYSKVGAVPPSDIDSVEVYSGWNKTKPIAVLTNTRKKFASQKLYLVAKLSRNREKS